MFLIYIYTFAVSKIFRGYQHLISSIGFTSQLWVPFKSKQIHGSRLAEVADATAKGEK